MEKNWIYESIFGADGPTSGRPLPPLPIIDNPSQTVRRLNSTDELLRRAERAEAIKSVMGPDFWKEAEELNFNTNPPYTMATLPPATRDPRKPACSCDCQFCLASDHINCQDGCTQSDGSIPPAILDIATEVCETFKDALRSEFRKQLSPSKKVRKSKDDLPGYSWWDLVGQFK